MNDDYDDLKTTFIRRLNQKGITYIRIEIYSSRKIYRNTGKKFLEKDIYLEYRFPCT